MVLVPSMSSFVDGESINMDCPFIVELFLRIRLVNTVEPKIKVSLHDRYQKKAKRIERRET